jgi:hypothetical protein
MGKSDETVYQSSKMSFGVVGKEIFVPSRQESQT